MKLPPSPLPWPVADHGDHARRRLSPQRKTALCIKRKLAASHQIVVTVPELRPTDHAPSPTPPHPTPLYHPALSAAKLMPAIEDDVSGLE